MALILFTYVTFECVTHARVTWQWKHPGSLSKQQWTEIYTAEYCLFSFSQNIVMQILLQIWENVHFIDKIFEDYNLFSDIPLNRLTGKESVWNLKARHKKVAIASFLFDVRGRRGNGIADYFNFNLVSRFFPFFIIWRRTSPEILLPWQRDVTTSPPYCGCLKLTHKIINGMEIFAS